MPIEISRPETASEAARILTTDRDAFVLGGGTGLMRRIHEGDGRVRHLIRLRDPDLTQISRQGAGLWIGAQVTMAQVVAAPEAASLHAAAASVGAPALRNMATIGGNLFARPPYGDLTVALLALDAEVETATPSGRERRPLDAVLRDHARRAVTGVILPDTSQTLLFHKMSRSHPRGASIVTLALHLPRSGPSRVAVGGLGGRPFRAIGSERALGSGAWTRAGIDTAASRIAEGITPHSDALASGWYRERMAQVQFKRLAEGVL